MVDTRDECVHCGLPCLGNACTNRSVTHYICDECGDETDPEELYIYDDAELCRECLCERIIEKCPTVADRL